MNKTVENSQRRFEGRIAKEYTTIEQTVPYYHALQKEAANFISDNYKYHDAPIIIDLGCGTGTTTIAIARMLPQAKIIAVDNEPDMISMAKKRLENLIESNRVQLKLIDAYAYLKAQTPECIDAIISGFMIHNLYREDRIQLLSACIVALRSGGLFANADKYALDHPVLRSIAIMRQIKRIINVIGFKDRNFLWQWIRHYLQDIKPPRLMKRKRSLIEFTAAGFSNVRYLRKENMEAILVARKPFNCV